MNTDTTLLMKLKKAINDVYTVSDSSIEQLRHYLEPFSIEKGGQIVTQGIVSRNIYFVLEGMLRCYTIVDGIEYTRWFATPGDVVTSMFSYCHNLPSTSSISALSDVKGFYMRMEDARNLIAENNEWALWCVTYLMEGLFILERRQTLLGYGDAQRRYLNFLRSRSSVTFNNIPLQHIASYLGMTPQTLSRVRRKVANDTKLYTGDEFPETDL